MNTGNPAAQAAVARTGSGLFFLDRGLIEVTGSDRVRWLNGMVSNDVGSLAAGSGCYALLLTRQGRIVADFHVLARPECFWLETAPAAVPAALAILEKFIVADDVTLMDRSKEMLRLGLEGPNSSTVIEFLMGKQLTLDPGASVEIEIEGQSATLAAFGFGGGPALQLFIQGESEIKKESFSPLFEALEAAGSPLFEPEALEIMRIEGGIPGFGNELGEDVLPAEARLERAISTTKGCYTGQEVIERMRSRGRVGHLMVGLTCEAEPPAPGTALQILLGEEAGDQDKRVGEVTSSCRSDVAGSIALAFVRSAHSTPGTLLAAAGGPVEVVELPFVDGSVALHS